MKKKLPQLGVKLGGFQFCLESSNSGTQTKSTGITLSQKDQAVTKQIPSVSIFLFGYLVQFSSQVVESPDFPAQNLQIKLPLPQHQNGRKGQGHCCLVLGNLKTFVPGKSMLETFQILSRTQFLTFPPHFKFTCQIFLFSLKLMCLSSWSPNCSSPKCYSISCSYYRMSSLSLIQPGFALQFTDLSCYQQVLGQVIVYRGRRLLFTA